MKAITAQDAKKLDAEAEKAGIGLFELMSSAGQALAASVQSFFRLEPGEKILVLAGKGNNGGDGFAAASVLSGAGYDVKVFCPFDEKDFSPAAAQAFRSMPASVRMNVSKSLVPKDVAYDDVVIDAMLGTGSSGVVKEPFASWIKTVASSSARVASADVPTGLSADTGKVADGGECITSDLTVTFAAPKKGLFLNEGPRRCGRILVRDIGIPTELLDGISDFFTVDAPEDFRRMFPREDFDTYKNKRGNVLVIGGSASYPSAPLLASESALWSGAGLVTVVLPESAEIVSCPPKSLIVRRVPDNGSGVFGASSAEKVLEMIGKADAVAIGCGMTCTQDTTAFLEKILPEACRKPLVLDADGLNVLAARPDLMKLLQGGKCVLTPHKGEFARLAGKCVAELDENDAEKLASATGCVVVVKGSHTSIRSSDGKVFRTITGCPALATAGSGDVLTGVIASILARGYDACDAARCGVTLHGLSGDLLACSCSYRGITAEDVMSAIPRAIRKISHF